MSFHCTIESSHGRILDKISLIRGVCTSLQTLRDQTRAMLDARQATLGAKYDKAKSTLENMRLNLILDTIDSIDNEYALAIANILGSYYSAQVGDPHLTAKYYQIVTAENIPGRCNDALKLCTQALEALSTVLGKRLISGPDRKIVEDSYGMICGDIDYARGMTVGEHNRTVQPHDVCKCGFRMQLVSETAELKCESCLRVKKVVGTVLHYDAGYSDGQKSKHNGYDIVRHLRFWLERLQALEIKTFEDSVLAAIAYVLKRDGTIKTDLTCERMRKILKDPCVDATYLNDHVPLLVKTFGGRGPPTFDYDETRVLTARFIRAMNIHADLKPSAGNKPYYPHFIYKIAEELFKSNPEKLRILQYIHLQSADTIEKNDQYFADVCSAVNDPDSGLVYRPTK